YTASVEWLRVVYAAITRAALSPTARNGAPPDPGESYPVPRGADVGGSWGGAIRTPLVFGDMAALTVSFSSGVSRRDQALADLRARTRAPFTVLLRGAEPQRFTKLSAPTVMTVSPIGSAGAAVAAPPLSPPRP